MANNASAEKVAADMRPPDYRYAVQMIRGAIEKRKTKISSLNGEISDDWAKIESKGVHKKGARMFAAIDKLEHAERMDIMRSFNGLCDAAGWPESEGDMVDSAEGTVVPMRMRDPVSSAEVDPEDDDFEDDGDDGEEDDEPEPAPAARAGRKRGIDVLRDLKAANAFGVGVVEFDAEQRRAQKVQEMRKLGEADPDFA